MLNCLLLTPFRTPLVYLHSIIMSLRNSRLGRLPLAALSALSSSPSSPSRSSPLAALDVVPSPRACDYFSESNIHEDILITFTLPGGAMHQQKVKSGETVQELKRQLYASLGIPFSRLTLFHNGKRMLDPLSLNDIAGVVDNSGSAQIEVKQLN